jgi:hypothetical protein
MMITTVPLFFSLSFVSEISNWLSNSSKLIIRLWVTKKTTVSFVALITYLLPANWMSLHQQIMSHSNLF